MNFWAYKKNKKNILSIILIGAIFVFLKFKVLYHYFTSPFVPGWDAQTHFGFVQYYSQYIFPSFFGWIPTWFNGMPFPQFYPPLFYYFHSILIKTFFFIEPILIFKTVNILIFLATIVFLGLLYRRHIDKEGEYFQWVIVIGLLFGISKFGLMNLGFGLSSVVNIGVLPHAFSLLLILVWLYFTIDLKNRRNIFFSIILLACIILTNVHAAFSALFIFLILFILDYTEILKVRKLIFELIFKYVGVGLIAILISVFWIVPYLYFSDYSAARYFENNFDQLYRLSMQLVTLLSFAGATLYFILKGKIPKNKFILLISIYTIIAFIFLFIDFDAITSLPIHKDRLSSVSIMFFPILFVYIVTRLKPGTAKLILASAVILLLAKNLDINGQQTENFFRTLDDYSEVIEKTKMLQGKTILVETISDDGSFDSILNINLGLFGSRSPISILRESSISSIFFVPIRNSFSLYPEYWAVRSRLSLSNEFLNRSNEEEISNVKMIGVTDLLIRTQRIKEQLDLDAFVKKENFGKWKLFEIRYSNQESPYFDILKFKPVLLVSDLDTKNYHTDGIDFISFSELLLQIGERDMRIVHAYPNTLDAIDLNHFSFVLIDNEFEQNHKELISKIKASGVKVVVENNQLQYGSLGEEVQKRFITQIKKFLIPTQYISMEDVQYIDGGESYFIQNKAKTPLYIVIKKSHYPTWEGTMLVNPSLQFVILEPGEGRSFNFGYPKVFFLAHGTSLLGILICGGLYFLLGRKKLVHRK